MSTKHTPEPWIANEYIISAGDQTLFISLGNQNAFMDMASIEEQKENVKRAVACVNAMAGIEDPEAFMKHIEKWVPNFKYIIS